MTQQAFDASTALAWDEAGIEAVELDASGRIIDFLDPAVTRAATPEERVRQRFTRALVEEYEYAKDCIALNTPINIGSETNSQTLSSMAPRRLALPAIRDASEL